MGLFFEIFPILINWVNILDLLILLLLYFFFFNYSDYLFGCLI